MPSTVRARRQGLSEGITFQEKDQAPRRKGLWAHGRPCIVKAGGKEVRVTDAIDHGFFDSHCPQESPGSSAVCHCSRDTHSSA